VLIHEAGGLDEHCAEIHRQGHSRWRSVSREIASAARRSSRRRAASSATRGPAGTSGARRGEASTGGPASTLPGSSSRRSGIMPFSWISKPGGRIAPGRG
jgi:hypothetical protein